MEKYLGDIIHEKGCGESITATIKERMRKLTSKFEDIIQIANTTLKGGLRKSNKLSWECHTRGYKLS